MTDAIAARRAELRPALERGLDFAAEQARRLLRERPGYYPMYTVGGRWGQEPESWTHWCEGFFPGILWLLHKRTGAAEWRGPAESYSRRLEPRRHDRAVHDLGFIFFSTYLRWYRLTGDAALRDVLIEAGRTLALRRQQGGYLASFLGLHSLFIDIMMNVGIIFWAANATGDAELRQVALEHCRTSARYLVRRDGGTAHEAIFDVETGQFLRESTQQGYRADSTWSRGLAWSLYGFTAVNCLSGEAEFLDIARRNADYYLGHTPEGLVPRWDYNAPADAPQYWDSSAAAIAASGFWDLAEAVNDSVEKERYYNASLTILETLCSDRFLARNTPGWEGILKHGVYHLHKRLGVDESVAWGEHFFVEALAKALAGRSEAAW